jgi:hypothetical protein
MALILSDLFSRFNFQFSLTTKVRKWKSRAQPK